MEKHTNPPLTEESEENLLDQLEDRLADIPEGEDPFAAVQPILDELDRRNGPAEFDPAQGWSDLLDRQKPKKHRRFSLKKYPFAAILVVLCLMTAVTALAVNFGLHEKLAAYFHINEENRILVENAVDTPDCTVTKNGVTITVKQSIADSTGIYVLYEVSVPNTITLTDDMSWQMSGFLDLSQLYSGSYGYTAGNEVLAIEPHRMDVMAYAYNPTGKIVPGTLKMQFHNLGYWSNLSELEFSPVIEGDWTLEWELVNIEKGISVSPKDPLPLLTCDSAIKQISLSPISLMIVAEGNDPPDSPVYLLFRDGTKIPLNETNSTDILGGFPTSGDSCALDYYHYFRFHTAIDQKQVERIVIGTTEIPLE